MSGTYCCVPQAHLTSRTLRKLSGEKAPVAKLVGISRLHVGGCRNKLTSLQFAKHMKIKEQVDFLKKKRIGFGVGTPERVAALIEKGEPSVQSWRRLPC